MNFLASLKEISSENGGKTAFVDRNGTRITTYAELDALSDNIAYKILASGIVPGSCIMVCMDRCMEYPAAEIGILKAGCTFVPVLAEYPRERIEAVKSDCGAVIVIDKSYLEDIGSYPVSALPDVSGDSPAFIIYTSGTTGSPKGVIYTRNGMDMLLSDLCGIFGDMIRNISFGMPAPFSFIVSVHGFAALVSGSAVHILSENTASDIRRLEDYFERFKLDAGFMSPKILKLYRNRDKALKVIAAGSEKLTGFVPGDFTVVNTYGQSEHGLISSYAVDRLYENTPVGKPPKGTEIRIIGDDGREVSAGLDGEICVVGGASASGYLNLPEKTAEVFEKLPDGRTMVHTGDIGRILADGNLLYVNRRDCMVKINGMRVEPGEVESAVREIPEIEDAAVKHFTNESGQVYLAAFYTGVSLDGGYLVEKLSERLPKYMIPSRFVYLDKLPLNENGKIDRKALFIPNESLSSEYAGPYTEDEVFVCEAFEKVLKIGRVGVNDDFFALGGDSVKAMELQNEISNPKVTAKSIYAYRTPARIASVMKLAGDADLLEAAMAEERELYPLSASARDMYNLSSLAEDGSAMHVAFYVKTDHAVDPERLCRAVEAAFDNHPIFSYTVVTDGGVPYFKKYGGEKRRVGIVKVDADDFEEYAAGFEKPFRFDGSEPLYRCEVVDTGLEYAVLFDIHHVIFDGGSLAVLAGDISRAYDGLDLTPEIIHPHKLGIYEEFVSETEDYRRAERYLGKVYSKLIPGVFPKGDLAAADSGETKKISVSVEKWKVDKLLRESGITEGSLFMCVYAYTLSRYLKRNDIVFQTTSHARYDSRYEYSVGSVAKKMPYYARIPSNAFIAAYLRESAQILTAAVENDIYPYENLVREYGMNSDLPFVYQGDTFTSVTLSGRKLPVSMMVSSRMISKLLVHVYKLPLSYQAVFFYAEGRYSEKMIKSFADSYVYYLNQFMEKRFLNEIEPYEDESSDALGTID